MKSGLMARATELRVADEVWIATALLHREHPERDDFTVKEIVERARQENITGGLRPGVALHASFHSVANKDPQPSQLRMLYDTGKGRRLYREGDPAHPKRKGKIVPDAGAIPARYRPLLDWYRNEYAASREDAWLKAVKDLAGAGKDVFAGVDADEYVRQLREGWE